MYCSPRVGDDDFVQIFNAQLNASGVTLWRIVNGVDPVPVTPPLFLDFVHVGKMAYYKARTDKPRICDSWNQN